MPLLERIVCLSSVSASRGGDSSDEQAKEQRPPLGYKTVASSTGPERSVDRWSQRSEVVTSLGEFAHAIVDDGAEMDTASSVGLPHQGLATLDCGGTCIVVLVTGVQAEGIGGIRSVELQV